MKTKYRDKPLTFGEFIATAYKIYGKRQAAGLVRIAVKAQLLRFLGPQRFVCV